MITKIDITSTQGGFLSLPMNGVVTGFPVQEIDGLDPVKATLVSTTFTRQDGAQYQGGRREPRNLKFTLGIEPNWKTGETIRSLRQLLYSALMPKSSVMLEFTMADGLVVDIDGVVESFESAIFSKDPVVDVVILCFDPDFIEPAIVELDGNTVTDNTMTNFVYEGTVETGMLLELAVDRTITGFTVYHTGSDGVPRSMLVSADLVAGDLVSISTVSGNKYATLRRAGSDSSILYGVAPQADWFQIQPGDNALRVELAGTAIPYTVSYLNRYGGL